MSSEISVLENILGIYCLITAQIRFALPGQQIYEIYQTKKTQKFPYTVLLCTLCNCTLWEIYFTKHYEGFYLWINAVFGICINVIYLLVFIYHLEIESLKKKFLMACTLMFPFMTIQLWNYFDINVQNTGLICFFFNCSLFVAPMQKVKFCIEEQDNQYLPIKLIVLNLLGSIGFLSLVLFCTWDKILFSVFCFSTVISIIQIFIWNYYRKDDFISSISDNESFITFNSFVVTSKRSKQKHKSLKNNFKNAYEMKAKLLKDDFQ